MKNSEARKLTVAVIGGHKKTYLEMLSNDFEFVFDDARNSGKDFRGLVRQSDVIVFTQCTCHSTMKKVRKLAGKMNKKVIYHFSRGGHSAIRKIQDVINH
ncbi:DUF2325 domain-containing protein [Brevibacillus sp. AG]|uniref:DUF2325 domain-containing protein n=1 Tax=Brevibacillus sp. AG TaxID=3020891 RepID=UPI002330EDF5|nr:DUF2325 domain-containing protein [Brevibacillus sp. AG]MDC0764266.1 DUF2325 domain-containing protein [Brevibacillus sp. AG]